MLTNDIIQLGQTISDELGKMHFTSNNELIIQVDKEKLKKIDEDLYYRNNPDGKDFVPSEREVILGFDNSVIKIVSA